MSRATVVVDLGFGDAGKGSVVDYLVRQDETVGTVVRFNGGPQAAHRVVERTWKVEGERSHVFAQFGSGSLVPGVRTLLARGMLVNPANLMREWEGLRKIGVRDALARLTVDPECAVITPWPIIANRTIEYARGGGRHGSCGQGVGETRSDELAGVVLRAHECRTRSTLIARLREIRDMNAAKIEGVDVPVEASLSGRAPFESEIALERVADTLQDPRWLGRVGDGGELRRYAEQGTLVFEGAQGALLDERHGFYPYTTWTDTTARNAYELLDEIGLLPEAHTLGLVRAYATRHGAGPLPTEDAALTERLPDPENGEGRWQGRWRVGWLDFPLLRYALTFCPVDSLAVTCLDRIEGIDGWKACAFYGGVPPVAAALPGCDPVEHGSRLTEALYRADPIYLPVPPTTEAYLDLVPTMTGVPVSLVSAGPTHRDKTAIRDLAPA